MDANDVLLAVTARNIEGTILWNEVGNDGKIETEALVLRNPIS